MMKAIVLAALCAALPATTAVPAQKGSIVFFRSATLAGAGLACPIRYKGVEIIELGRGKYAQVDVKPGRYIFANRSSGVEVSVDPGETRYVRCRQNNMSAEIQLVDEETYQRYAKDLEPKDMPIAEL